MLSGYKTYIMAGVGVIGAVAGWLVGDLTIAEAGQIALTAVLASTVRAGVSTESKKKGE